jgi:hypothetical protein
VSTGGEHPAGADASAKQAGQAGDHDAQINNSPDDRLRLDVTGGRDVYAALRDLTVHHYAAAGESAADKPVVVGDVPQEPAAFQPRADLMAALEQKSAGRVSVVFAVTGIRGVGKTQVAAAYARRRMTEGWRLVAWVDASDEVSVLSGLAQVATAVGVPAASKDARVLAARVRHWLEVDGERRLVVFDNAIDLDVVRPFVPAGGAAQVVITSSRRSAAGLGIPVPVDMFSESEALAFLAERTGLDDIEGARALAGELGWLPLALAQAAALIAREHLSYRTYLGRLRALPVAGYLGRAEGDAYPRRLAEAITLSLLAVEGGVSSGMYRRLMGLLSVLGRDPGGVRELAGQLSTVAAHIIGHPGALSRGKLEDLLRLRGRSVYLLNELGDSTGLAILAAEPLVTDCEELLGSDHPDTLTARNTLGSAYRAAGRAGEAIEFLGRTAADRERVLGSDHPDTLTSRNALAGAYRLAGKPGDAFELHTSVLTDMERMLGTSHPATLTSANNLALSQLTLGRTAQAATLLERTLIGCERTLGSHHPDTLRSQHNLALAYLDDGGTTLAVNLLEQTLADRERVLGRGHPLTAEVRKPDCTDWQAEKT